MKRRHLGALALAFAMFGACADDAHAFGKSLFKRRAKREAKKRAKREAAKKLAEQTGVNVAGLVDGDASAVAQGMAKDAAMGAVAQSAAGPYAKYVGMSPAAIKDALKADIMKEKGINRFSPPAQRRSVDRLVDQRFGKVQKALATLEALKGGGVGGRLAGAQALAESNAQAVMDGDMSAQEALGSMAADTKGEIGGAVESLTVNPTTLIQDAVQESRAQAEERIRAEVYRSKGIRSGSPRIKKLMADKVVDQKLKALFP